MPLFTELRRRNVLKVGLLYALAAALFVWLAGGPLSTMGVSPGAIGYLLLIVIIGFPVALIFAWTYEITPTGLKKSLDVEQTQSIVYKTGQKLNAAMAVLAVLGVMAFVGERLMPTFEFPKIIEPLIPEPTYEAPLRSTTPEEIRAYTLENGLRIIVWPDHDIPNVVMYNFVRAGGRNEYPGITGLSHFFEHMMFNGTEARAQGEFDETMEAAGGANNAYTSKDLTVYQDWFPKSALEIIFDLEGDRLQNLAIEPNVVESERGVVYSERRRGIDSDNDGRLFEQMFATAYVAHPYQFPVIGWPSDIENWTQTDLETFFETYYAPNNLTMVFTGDVIADEIFDLADEYFGRLKSQAPPGPVRTVEPPQSGARRIVVETDAPTPLLHVAFHAGRAADADTLAMRVLLNILADGDSSRLHQQLVEDSGLALSVGSYLLRGFDPGLAYFYLTLPPDADVAAVESALRSALDDVANNGVLETELQKARNIMIADYWRRLATINGKAAALGEAEVFMGSYEHAFLLPDALAAVAADDIKAIASKVFQQKQMTVGVLRSPEVVE